MKLLLFLQVILVHLPWAFSLVLRDLDGDAYVGRRASPAVMLRNQKTSHKTFFSDRNWSRSPAVEVEEVIDDKFNSSKIIDSKIRHDKDDKINTTDAKDHQNQPMIATPQGICMYTLPAHFNVGLLNSTFGQPVPQPHNISPSNDPPLEGMFDTIQFSLERIFYDRFVAAATSIRPARDCVMFYVPYFVAWETSAVHNTWLSANRPELDRELFTHLTHYNDSGLPGHNHFIVIGRISFNVFHFLDTPIFYNMLKLVLEDTAPGQYPNVFAIPYPTWFRYYPGLEPSGGLQKSIIKVQSAAIEMKRDAAGCNPSWIGNLTERMRTACDGKEFCSYHLLPDLDHWVVGKVYEARDANGKWWPVTIKSQNPDGTFSVDVHDGPGSHWPQVYVVHMRKRGEQAAAAMHTAVQCLALNVSGQYSCGGDASYAFKSLPGQVAVGHAVALGCPRGPCWLWGTCQRQLSLSASASARNGPLLAFIGSARATEYERIRIFQMCQERPLLCSIFDTGARENSTSFIHSRIADMYQSLMASTFCVNPPGDTPTRKGIFDSLVLGCIPVITSEDSIQHYSFHLPFWRNVSLLVTTDQLFSLNFNLVDFLESYERDHMHDILQKQDAIRRYAYSLQYSFHPSTVAKRGPDAFERTLQELMKRPVSPANSPDFAGVYTIVNVASGRRLFAYPDGDYGTSFGASTADSQKDEQKWRIVGRGDGSCCYSIINVESKRTLYAQVNATHWTKFGASVAYSASWADQRWRLSRHKSGAFNIVNVGSGRSLFATPGGPPGNEGNIGIGASLSWAGKDDRRWKLVKVENPGAKAEKAEKPAAAVEVAEKVEKVEKVEKAGGKGGKIKKVVRGM